MDWKSAQARQEFSRLLQLAAREPQRIFIRDRMAAAVIDGDTFLEFERWRGRRRSQSVGSAFAELRQVCEETGYALEAPPRISRDNPFA